MSFFDLFKSGGPYTDLKAGDGNPFLLRPGETLVYTPDPEVRDICSLVKDLREAAIRADKCFSRAGLTDALRSVRYWLELAEAELARKPGEVQPPPTEL